MDNPQHISKPKLKFAKSLSQKKVRADEALFVIEGWRALEDACGAGVRARTFIYTPEAKANTQYARIFASAIRMADESFEASEHELSTVADTVTAQGVVMLLPQFSHTLDAALSGKNGKVVHEPASSGRAFDGAFGHERRIIVAMDKVSEPGNAGTIIRTADWFGADAVLLSEACVDLYNPKVIRSTMGSIFHLPVIESGRGTNGRTFADALSECRRNGFRLYGADVGAQTDLRNVTWAPNSLIVIGNEAHGLTPDVSALIDESVTIPKFGKAESLNAGIAAAVILGNIRFCGRS